MANNKEKPDKGRKQDYKEKRIGPRLKREIIVQYRRKAPQPLNGLQILVPVATKVDMSRTRDLSETGICFTSSHPFEKETIMDISLRLPTRKRPLRLDGKVVGYEEMAKNLIYLLRIQFINLKEEDKKLLKEFLEKWKE